MNRQAQTRMTNTTHAATNERRTPRSLLLRSGVALAALSTLLLAARPSLADDDKSKPQKPPEPPTNDTQEILRRLREEAAKAGVDASKVNPPAPAPAQPAAAAPAPGPTASPVPTPAAPAVKQPDKGHPIEKPAPTGPVGGLKPVPGAAPNQPMRPGTPQPAGSPQPMPAGGATNVPNVNPADALRGDTFNFNFSEPVDLTLLVTYVRDALNLQIIFIDGGLAGQKIYLNSPVTVKRDQVLYFITMLLEQKEYTLVQDRTGIYFVIPKNQITGSKPMASEFSTTRIIRTPNIKPSSLQTAIQGLINANRGGQTAGVQPIYMDEIGLMIVTESPRVLMLVEEFVNSIVAERAELRFFRFELQNISAASARDRVLEILGQQTQRFGAQPGQPGQPVQQGAPTTTITNLGERVTIDPASNAVLLRGRDDERKLLSDLLAVVDVPNSMLTRWYPVGLKTSEAVASAGTAEQLGSVSSFESSESGGGRGGAALRTGAQQQPGQFGAAGSNQSTPAAGAGFTIYPEAGGFFYRGTESQHRRVAALVESMRGISADELVTYEFYKLRHGKAVDVAEVVQNLLSNSAPTGNRGGLLGNDLGTRNRRSANPPRGVNEPRAASSAGAGTGNAAGNSVADLEGADVFVLADEPNNQIVVKAPSKLQPQFRRLIDRIDLRRPQVYIDAKIIAVNEGDDFRLAIETQQIIGQFAFNTNFGLGSLTTSSGTGTGATTTGGFTSPKNVAPGLSGITAALIRSKDVPFIVNALARDTKGRIVASPQLLVDDNTEAEISSIEQQATSTTTQQQGNAQVSGFSGYEDAGPKLTVKPQISDGGYLRLDYKLELSSFTGAATGSLPPPRQKNEIKSESVTIPTDSTIVIGGLTLENVGKTIVKIPLLGDIPLVGQLFRDESETKRRTTLYAFITPKIMRDPSFADLRLLTRAPLVDVGIPTEFPPPQPERIDILETAKWETRNTLDKEAEKNKRPEPISPEKGAPVRRDPPQNSDPE